MSAPQLGSAPSAELFFQTVKAYQRTAALRAAIELDVFTAIAEGNVTSDTIAGHIGASVKGIRVLAELNRMFTAAGFSRSELHPIPGSPQQVILSWK
jgi:hypothetical protein